MENIDKTQFAQFLTEIKAKIRDAQLEALRAVNKHLINLYWDIGKTIVARQEAHGWGKSIVEKLALELQKEFPEQQGFSSRNLWKMREFYLELDKNEFLQPLVAEISWTKIIVILEKCKDELQREFYIRSTKKFGWTKAILIHQIENKSYEKYLLNQTSFDQMKLEGENDAIGIIICKTKDKTVVEYALKSTTRPIGVATYTLTSKLPADYLGLLPSADDIRDRLTELE